MDASKVRVVIAPPAMIGAAARIAVRCYTNHPPVEEVANRMRLPGSVTVIAQPIDDDFLIMGVATATIYGNIAELREWMVPVLFQGRGIGRGLIVGMVNHLSLKGIGSVVVDHCKSQRASNLLETVGFSVIEKREYGDKLCYGVPQVDKLSRGLS